MNASSWQEIIDHLFARRLYDYSHIEDTEFHAAILAARTFSEAGILAPQMIDTAEKSFRFQWFSEIFGGLGHKRDYHEVIVRAPVKLLSLKVSEQKMSKQTESELGDDNFIGALRKVSKFVASEAIRIAKEKEENAQKSKDAQDNGAKSPRSRQAAV